MPNQKGVSLIIIFLIMTIMIAIVLSISTILFSEVKIIGGVGNSVLAFFAADTGIEKTLYFNRKNVLNGASRGLCNICNVCNSAGADQNTVCNNCVATPLAANGCDTLSCSNCQVTYDSVFNNGSYSVLAKVSPDLSNPNIYDLAMSAKGYYRDAMRQIGLSFTSTVAVNNTDSCPNGSQEVPVDPKNDTGTPFGFGGDAGQYRVEIYSPVGLDDSSYGPFTWANWSTDDVARIHGGDVFLLKNKMPVFQDTGDGLRVQNADATIGAGTHVDPPYNQSRLYVANWARGSYTTVNLQPGDNLVFIVNGIKGASGQGGYAYNTGLLHVRICPMN